MLPHAFSHDGATYVVSFKPIKDQWRAALYKRDDGSITELGPVAPEALFVYPITPFEPVILGWRNGW